MKSPGRSSGSDSRLPIFPRVAFSIIGVTLFFFVLQIGSQVFLGRDVFVEWGAKNNALIRQGELWRLVTPLFLHGSVLHIGLNLFVVLVMGGHLERAFGSIRFFLLYFLSGFAGYAFSFLTSGGATIGSSTAIFGLAGATALTWFRNRVVPVRFPSWSLGIILFIAITSFLSESSLHVDDLAHVGGLFGGLMFTWFAGPVWDDEDGQVVDLRPSRDVVVGTAVVLLIFGVLAIWGMMR